MYLSSKDVLVLWLGLALSIIQGIINHSCKSYVSLGVVWRAPKLLLAIIVHSMFQPALVWFG